MRSKIANLYGIFIRASKSVMFFLLPLGIVKLYHNKKISNSSIANSLLEYRGIDNKFSSSKISNNFKQVISVQGFGYSGSGALIDVLNEFKSVTVIGYIDEESNAVISNNRKSFEVDLFRISGGFFEIEKLIKSKNIFINDALINRLILLIDDFFLKHTFSFGKEVTDNNVRNIFLNFLDNLIDFSIDIGNKEYYNAHLNIYNIALKSRNSIYFMNEISADEYIGLVRKLMYEIFNLLPKNDLLVLDQFFGDNEYNIENNNKYIANLKIIFVQRDPRDVYTFAKKNDVKWIPTDNLQLFIKWYKMLLKNFPIAHSHVLNLKFEELVNDYENSIEKITTFLEVCPDYHVRKKEIFDPRNSIKNTGIWRSHEDLKYDNTVIEDELSEYCYND